MAAEAATTRAHRPLQRVHVRAPPGSLADGPEKARTRTPRRSAYFRGDEFRQLSITGTAGRAGLRMERGDPGRSDEGRGSGGVARGWCSGREPLDRPRGNDAVRLRFAGEGESDRNEEGEVHRDALERHALVVERRGVCLVVVVAGFTLVKLGAVNVHGGGVVVRAHEMSFVRERVQHRHAGRDEVRDQRKAGDEEPPTERARMHRHAVNLGLVRK